MLSLTHWLKHKYGSAALNKFHCFTFLSEPAQLLQERWERICSKVTGQVLSRRGPRSGLSRGPRPPEGQPPLLLSLSNTLSFLALPHRLHDGMELFNLGRFRSSLRTYSRWKKKSIGIFRNLICDRKFEGYTNYEPTPLNELITIIIMHSITMYCITASKY